MGGTNLGPEDRLIRASGRDKLWNRSLLVLGCRLEMDEIMSPFEVLNI